MTHVLLNDYAVNTVENDKIIKPNIDIQDCTGATALHLLAAKKLKFTWCDNTFYHSDNYIILRILFNYNINSNIQDYNGNTALHYASKKNSLLTKELLIYGANPFILNNVKYSMLDYLNTKLPYSTKEIINFICSKYPDLIELSRIGNRIIIYNKQKLLHNSSCDINENNTINFDLNDPILLGDIEISENINNNA
ncbi:MAG TPA: ankyrin repeat domain-containing protein [Rickettsia endosymbiont of Pyrocoelia pectoralis]|nr:ankyrin repeat domain-containing protein [Rickettsia endosymbiont of Pyrocoelia pectoralis]